MAGGVQERPDDAWARSPRAGWSVAAGQAGAADRDGEVGRLLLTHLAWADVDACVAAAAEVAGCPVIGARAGGRLSG